MAQKVSCMLLDANPRSSLNLKLGQGKYTSTIEENVQVLIKSYGTALSTVHYIFMEINSDLDGMVPHKQT